MKKQLNEELERLKVIGGQESLVSELEAFIETVDNKSIPISRRLLAQAALEIRNGHLDLGHDFLGASLDSFAAEREGKQVALTNEVTSSLDFTQDPAPEGTFEGVPLPDVVWETSPTFEEAGEDVVMAFANLLITGNYTQEAQAYLSGYNILKGQEQGEEGMDRKEKDTLKKLRAKFKAEANLNMVKVIDLALSEAEGVGEARSQEIFAKAESFTKPEIKAKAKRAGFMMKAAEELMTKEGEDKTAEEMAKSAEELMEEVEKEAAAPAPAPEAAPVAVEPEGEEKEVLEVEPASEEEEKAKEEAQAALAKGDLKAARLLFKKANRLERTRLIAALARKGDFVLAMEGLAEAEAEEGQEDEIPADEKNAGMQCKSEDSEEVTIEEDTGEEEMPEELKDKTEPKTAEECDEKDLSKTMAAVARKAVKAGNIKKAKEAVADLAKLENEIVANVKTAELEVKDMTLAKEGYDLWKEVRKNHLKAALVVAEAEKDEKAIEEVKEGMEALEKADDEDFEDALDAAPAESMENPADQKVIPPGGIPEGQPGEQAPVPAPAPEGEEEEGEEEGEAEAMHYEVLQSLDEIKAQKINRNDLAFTLWTDEKDPYWVIQANGKPVAEIHLADQKDPDGMEAFFCDQEKYPQVIAQATEKTGLFEMLSGVKARFYANALTHGKLAQEMKQKALAEVQTTKTEKLADLRKDFSDALVVAADQLNKGLIAGKPNALKKAFVERLASLGIHNPHVLVEDCFAEGFGGFMDQVIADAGSFMEMSKEAFEQTKKYVSSAVNLSQSTASTFSNETLGQRLGRTSMPLAHVPAAEEAPILQKEMAKASYADEKQNLKSKLKLSRRV